MSIPEMIFVPSIGGAIGDDSEEQGDQERQQIGASRIISNHSRWEESPGKSSFDSPTKSLSTPPTRPRRRRSNDDPKRGRLSTSSMRKPIHCPESLDEEPVAASTTDAQRRRYDGTSSLKDLMLMVASQARGPKTSRQSTKISYSM